MIEVIICLIICSRGFQKIRSRASENSCRASRRASKFSIEFEFGSNRFCCCELRHELADPCIMPGNELQSSLIDRRSIITEAGIAGACSCRLLMHICGPIQSTMHATRCVLILLQADMYSRCLFHDSSNTGMPCTCKMVYPTVYLGAPDSHMLHFSSVHQTSVISEPLLCASLGGEQQSALDVSGACATSSNVHAMTMCLHIALCSMSRSATGAC